MNPRKLLVIGNATERTYRQGDLSDKRRGLRGNWTLRTSIPFVAKINNSRPL